MNTAHPHDTKPSFIDRLSAFLQRFRIVFIVILITLAVALLALFIVLRSMESRAEKAYVRTEGLEESFSEWIALDESEREGGYDDLQAAIAEVEDAYPRNYAAQRAIFIDATALSELEHWQQASDRYVELADRFPDSYLAAISLMQAAVTAENAGDAGAALTILNRLAETYDANSAEIPRALFSIGRINEDMDNVAEAADAYNQLIDNYPGSSWTNLARDRIITLTVQGRIGS